ncbi:1854_t:CDS:1, partial [Entrophospora sp. SA101]
KRWKHASAPASVERASLIAKYFPELSFDSLENYSVCQKHYNQIVAKDSFLEKLQKDNIIYTSVDINSNKQLRNLRYQDLLS